MSRQTTNETGRGLPEARPALTAAQRELLEKWRRGASATSPPPSTIPRRPPGDRAPLSCAQERLWFLDRLQPNSALYNLAYALRVNGDLDVPALERSLNEIVRRHEILRTTFQAEGGEPVQVIAPELPVRLQVTDLEGFPAHGREAEARRLAAQAARLPFDLAAGPLFRAQLVRLGPSDHLLVLTLHHIVFDGWSQGVLRGELAAMYGAFRAGQPPPLPELPIQYADYAAWRGARLQGERLAPLLGHWRQRFTPLPAALELPTDRPRTAETTWRGGTETLQTDRELAAGLQSLCRRHGTTSFMTLLAVLKVLLHRYSGQGDITVGAPLAMRTALELEPLLGFFVNTVALRDDLSGDPPFGELLTRVRDTTLDALENQDAPFEKVVQALRPERAVGANPLFRVMFALQSVMGHEWALPGLSVSTFDVFTDTAKFDLTLFVTETDAGLKFALEYSTDLFEAETIRRMLGHYRNLLAGAAAHPNARLSELPLLADDERRALSVGWNQTQTDYPRNQCIHQLFEEQVERRPDAAALVMEDARWTYAELNARADRLAGALRAAGVRRGTLVALCLECSPEMVAALLGILKAGGAYVPLPPEYPKERLAFMLADTQAPVLLTQRHLTGRLPPHQAKVLLLDTSEVSPAAGDAPAQVASAAQPDDLAYVMYTSGSTGRPKGVAIPHRGIVRLVKNTNYAAFSADEVFLQFAPVSFDASTFEIWGPLLNGGRLAILPPGAASLEELGRAIARYQVTTLWLTAGLFHAMVDERLEDLRPLRALFSGGDVLSVPHVRRAFQGLPGCRLVNAYGPTENTTFTTCHTITERDLGGASIPIGRPISNSTVYLLDAHRQPVPVGVPGELHTGGDGLAREYLNQPALTREKFVRDPFSPDPSARLYRTGDLCRYRADGTIEFLGRLDQQVKLRGFRIELEEIESVLNQHPGVRESVVAAREDTPGDKRLVAYFVGRAPPPATAEGLREFLKSRLPDYMVPSAFVPLAALPLNPNGKVDRKALPAPATFRPAAAPARVAPRTPTEQSLALVWAEVLGAEVGVRDDFFEAGGHSLLAVRLLAKINQMFSTRLPLTILFKAPTIEQLARNLDGLEETQHAASLVPLQPRGTRPPLFWVHTIGEDNGGLFLYRKIVKHLDADQPSYGLEAPVQPFHDLGEAAADYLDRLKAIQPHGPYYLAGYCFGGHLAFEMARQLEQRGEPVGLLLLIETSAQLAHRPYPWHWRTPLDIAAHWSDWTADLFQRGLRDLGRRATHRLRTLPGRFKTRRDKQAAWSHTLDNTFNFAMHPPSFREYAHAHWEALRNYRPGDFAGPVALLRIRKHGLAEFDPYLRWREICRGPFTLRIVPGDHVSIFDEPNAQTLARHCQQCLDAARESAPAPHRPE